MVAGDGAPETRGYVDMLSNYLVNRSETELYHASLLSQQMALAGLGPDEIVALHMDAVADLTSNEGMPPLHRFRALEDAQQFLLEVMIGYGVHYKEHTDLIVEERQRAERESARSDRERSHLLASIAHEFGTPLTVSVAHVQRARKLLAEGRLEEASESIAEVAGGLDRLDHLLSNLQHASRSGELPDIDLSPCSLGAFIAEACSWVRADAERKEVTLHVDDSLEQPVLGDSEALRIILTNLLSNGVRYTRRGGRVTVATGSDDGRAWLEVSDTGLGMTEETLARLFEPFFRAADAQRATPQGLGLGLTITRRFVEALSGDIEVTSELGAGSSFKVFLPLAQQPEVPDAGVRDEGSSGV